MVFVNEVDLWASGAELAEQREGTEGNAGEQHTCRTPSRQSVSQGLERVRPGFMIREWQQTGRDDDFLLRGFHLVPGVEVCTRRTRAGFQEEHRFKKYLGFTVPAVPGRRQSALRLRASTFRLPARQTGGAFLRCDVITKVITSGAVRSNPGLSDRLRVSSSRTSADTLG